MTLQNGILTDIEDWAIDVLTALTDDDGNPLFKGVELVEGTPTQTPGVEPSVNHWLGQIGLGQSGVESFDRYAPFAFVQASLLSAKREGDYDANIGIELAILIGQKSEAPYLCRIGDATHVGTNWMFEKVFLAFDLKRPPAEAVTCDDFHLTDVLTNLELPKKHGLQLVFEANWIPVTNDE